MNVFPMFLRLMLCCSLMWSEKAAKAGEAHERSEWAVAVRARYARLNVEFGNPVVHPFLL